MEKLIQSGYNVCIWDKNILEKDVNDMILNGMTKESVLDSINKNTYSGLMAKLKLSEWRKIA